MDFSRLFLQSSFDYKIYTHNKKNFYIKKPTIKEIIELEKETPGKYFGYVYLLSSTSVDIADILYMENKIWYEDIKDEWSFFLQKITSDNMRSKKVKFITKKGKNSVETIISTTVVDKDFRDALNFFFNTDGEYIYWTPEKNAEDCNNIYIVNVKFDSIQNGEEIYLYDEDNFRLTSHIYYIMIDFLKKINWLNCDYDFLKGGSLGAKKYILKQRYKKRQKDAKRKPLIDLSSIISSIIAKGQKYEDILGYSIYLVYEIYYRLVKIDEWNNTMQALYTGCMDTKKNPINWEKINWSSIIE